MVVIPFRERFTKDWNKEFEFLFKPGDPKEKEPYLVKILIDDLDSVLLEQSCRCKGFIMKKTECKHLKKAKEILKEFGVEFDE